MVISGNQRIICVLCLFVVFASSGWVGKSIYQITRRIMLASSEGNEVKTFNYKGSEAPKLTKVTVDSPLLGRGGGFLKF